MFSYPPMTLIIVKGLILGIPLMALLIGPIYPLFELSSHEITETTLTAIMFTQLGFTCVFAACLKFLTRPMRHELFAASVTYVMNGLMPAFTNYSKLHWCSHCFHEPNGIKQQELGVYNIGNLAT